MNLYTYYRDGDKVVYGTFANGQTFFFYKGFASKEAAYQATFELHLSYKREEHKGSMRPSSLDRAWVESSLSGIWKEIQ